MDSKGLDVCNSLERDKPWWRCCCPDGRKAACCHDGLDSLTVGLRALRASAQFIGTKQGEEAQTGPAEYLAASASISKGQYSFEAQCSLSLTPLSNNTDSGFCSPNRLVYAVPRFTKHHRHQITFEASGPKLIYHSPSPFSISAGVVQNVGRMFGQI